MWAVPPPVICHPPLYLKLGPLLPSLYLTISRRPEGKAEVKAVPRAYHGYPYPSLHLTRTHASRSIVDNAFTMS